MKMSITGHHVEVTDALRAYVEKRMTRIVRHFDHLIDAVSYTHLTLPTKA